MEVVVFDPYELYEECDECIGTGRDPYDQPCAYCSDEPGPPGMIPHAC